MKIYLFIVATIILAGCSEYNNTDSPSTFTPTSRLGAGGYHTCLISLTGVTKCWGSNADGQLGKGDTAYRGDGANEMGSNLQIMDFGTGKLAKQIMAGENNSCVILDDDSLKCWGNNWGGCLGLGDTNLRGDQPNQMGDNLPAIDLGTGRIAKSLGVGVSHTCAVLDNGTAKCWGVNSDGQLGLEDASNRGDGPNEMGDNLPAISLGTGRTVKMIAAGYDHTCAILDNDSVKCWGTNNAGQLGLGDTNNRGDAAGEMGDNLPAVDLGTGRSAKSIVAGQKLTCAILDNDTVKCWGQNASGTLGLEDTANRGDGVNEMGDNLPAVSLGTGLTVESLSARFDHVCASFTDNSVKCWGYGGDGNLGQANTDNLGDNAGEMGNNLSFIDLGTGRSAKELVTAFNHACVLLDNDDLKCWGANWDGQLGQGDTNNRGDDPTEMGDNLPTVDLGSY